MGRIYGDSNLEREFRAKRQRLESLLKQNYDVPADFSITLDYDKDIDMFLYKTVGYDALNQICTTSSHQPTQQPLLVNIGRKGLKKYLSETEALIKKQCPILYNKLINTIEEMKE